MGVTWSLIGRCVVWRPLVGWLGGWLWERLDAVWELRLWWLARAPGL